MKIEHKNKINVMVLLAIPEKLSLSNLTIPIAHTNITHIMFFIIVSLLLFTSLPHSGFIII